MKATVEELNSVQRRVSVTVPKEVVTKAFNAVFANLQKKAKLDGFRPGKAPLSIIKRLYGQQAARDVADTLVDNHLYTAIHDHHIKIISAPVVELKDVPTIDCDYSFSAVVDMLPTIRLQGCYKTLNVACNEYQFNEETIERELKAVARRFATTSEIPADSTAALKHLATISHHGTVAGTEHAALQVKSAEVALGSAEVLPALEEAIIGMKIGESKELSFALPDTYGDATLAGKTVDLVVSLEDLKLLNIPAIDDHLAKDMEYENLAELRQKISSQLADHAAKQSARSKREAVFKALAAQLDFEVPPALVDQTIDSMIQEFSFLKDDDKKKAQRDATVRKSLTPEAKTKVKNTLILWQISKDEGLEVSDEEVVAELKRRFAELASASEAQFNKVLTSIGQQTRENLLLEKGMQVALNAAQVTATVVTL